MSTSEIDSSLSQLAHGEARERAIRELLEQIRKRDSYLSLLRESIIQKDLLLAKQNERAAALHSLLRQQTEQVIELKQAVQERAEHVADIEKLLTERQHELAETQLSLQELTSVISSIQQAPSYRLLQRLRQLIDRLAPPHSFRSALVATGSRGLDFFLAYGFFRFLAHLLLPWKWLPLFLTQLSTRSNATKEKLVRRDPLSSVIRLGLEFQRAWGWAAFFKRLIMIWTWLPALMRESIPYMPATSATDEIKQWYLHNRKEVTVVIPTYNDYELVQACVTSIKQLPSGRYVDIIVVDDGSVPSIQEKLASLNLPATLIMRKENEGFASTCNFGISAVGGGDVVLLNNDTIVHDGWIEGLQFYAYLQEDIGITGPKLLYPDNTIQWAGSYRNSESREWFDHNFRFKPHDYGPANVPTEVLAATGACMYIKRHVIETIGILDSQFEMAFEDVDYSLRAWNAGFKVVYAPVSVVTHLESKTRGKKQGDREIRSLERFWRKWGEWFDKRKVTNDAGKLKVIYVLQDTGIGGGARDIFEHLNGLIEAGHEVSLYATAPPPTWFELRAPVKSFRSYRELEEDLRQQEAIKVATWWETAPVAWRSSVTKGIPVYFVQDVETSYYEDSDPVRNQVLAWYKKEFNYFTISSWNRRQLDKLGLDAKIVAPGIDHSIFKPKGLERQSNMLLALGRSNQLKNLDFTIKAWNTLPVSIRPRLVLFGIEPNLGNRVGADYVTFPNDQEVADLYNKTTVFVQTSRHEGFCLPILEAMACGAPVICTNSDGNMDFCVDGKNCLIVEQDNVEQLAKAIELLFANDELRTKLSEAGLQTARRYNWQEKIRELENHYYNLTSTTTQAPHLETVATASPHS